MHFYSTTCMRKTLTIFIILLFVAFSTAVLSQGFSSSKALLNARADLMIHECNLECSRKVASVYKSQQFQQLIKNSLVKTLRASSNRTNDTLILFGKEIAQKELERMLSTDVFALQLLHRNQSTLAEYRYSKTEVLSKKYTSPNEMKIVVRKSGLPAEPSMLEQEIIHLIKEDGEWKMRY